MTPEIKNRIDQLRQGIVPEGYHKTPSGIVPDDWVECRLGDIYTERKEAGNPELPVLSVSIHSGVSEGELDEDELGKKVKRIEDKTQYRTAHSGDLVFNMMRAWQGAIGVVKNDGLVSPTYIVAKPNDRVFPVFMDYYMKTPRMVGTINQQSYGVTDFRKRLYWDSFKPINCAFPKNVEEQRKIAAILSTQDKVIEQKRKIIACKEKLKECYFQRFFSPRNLSYRKIKAKKIFENISDKNHDGKLEVLSATQDHGIVPRSEVEIDIKYDKESLTSYKRVRKGNFVISLRSFQGGIEYSKYEGIISPAYTVLKPVLPIIDGFYKQFFKSPNYINRLNIATYGIRDGKQISYSDFGEIEIPYPSIEEQQELADFFDMTDKDLELLKKDLELEKKKKKALMQLLLTGIVRVKP